jgi:hypothetical protein
LSSGARLVDYEHGISSECKYFNLFTDKEGFEFVHDVKGLLGDFLMNGGASMSFILFLVLLLHFRIGGFFGRQVADKTVDYVLNFFFQVAS